MGKEEEWEDVVPDDLEEEAELDFKEEPEEEKREESFYASRLSLIEQAVNKVKRR
tara:strand:- start:710 stop:874 length:165 start_codon:yes stop_codon:yes gene_type:complete